MKKAAIIIADDHPLLRRGVRAVLEDESDFTVVAEVGDGLEAVRQVEQFKPAILVTDIALPGLNGLEVVRMVGRRSPRTRSVVLSERADEDCVRRALLNGASAYVLKTTGDGELTRAIREALAGRRYLSPPFSSHAVETYAREAPPATQDPYEKLTDREREVLHLAADGAGNIAIGRRLSISSRTVEIHRAHMMRKLNLRGQAQLVRYAISRGILVVPAAIPRDAYQPLGRPPRRAFAKSPKPKRVSPAVVGRGVAT